MISFLDLFKWDRFVATSVIELLFWLLAAMAVLFGISGLISGLALVQLAPANGLLAIAGSIIGTLAAIVAARVVCEAVIMLFRVNENLMDIRDSLATAPERQPAATPEPAPASEAVMDAFTMAFEEMLPPPPMPAAPAPRVENRWSEPKAAETRAPEPRAHETRSHEPRPPESRPPQARPVEHKSAETSSLEIRLAEIRARREAAAAASRAAATTAPSQSPDAGLAGARMHLEEAAAPKWEAPPVVEARREPSKVDVAKPAAVEVKPPVAEVKPLQAEPDRPEVVQAVAPEVKSPVVATPEAKPVEAKTAEAKIAEPKPPIAPAPALEEKASEPKVPEPKARDVKAPEPKRSEAKKVDAKKTGKVVDEKPLVDATEAAEKRVEAAAKVLASEAEASAESAAEAVSTEKQKANDAA